MTNNEALEILNEHWSGRIDSPDRPDFDDINEALGKMEDAVKQLAEEKKDNRILLQALNYACSQLYQYEKPFMLQGGIAEWTYWKVGEFIQRARKT